MSDPDEATVAALAEVLLASWRAQGSLDPPFDTDRDDALEDARALLASPALADLLAKAEQRGREDNADHGQCYAHGSVALEALLRAERVRALRDAAGDVYRAPADAAKLAAWLRDRANQEAEQ